MNALDRYQINASSFAQYPEHIGLLYTILGLAGEVGEVANKVKKIYRDSAGFLTDLTREDLISELGDVFWYLSAVATEIDIPLSMIAEANILKLTQRQNRGTVGGSGDSR
jgi:NTP pyrophosphatase (non-canonical NTP hydrolase)